MDGAETNKLAYGPEKMQGGEKHSKRQSHRE